MLHSPFGNYCLHDLPVHNVHRQNTHECSPTDIFHETYRWKLIDKVSSVYHRPPARYGKYRDFQYKPDKAKEYLLQVFG